ncbi:hypothetical protein Tco_0738980 [Tanacetum coccineum]
MIFLLIPCIPDLEDTGIFSGAYDDEDVGAKADLNNLEITINATAKSKTVNDVKQIHATVDGKTMVISESSMRSDLHFNDEDGITCLSNDEIFVNLALMGNLDPTYKKILMYLRFLQMFLNNQIALADAFNDVYVTHVHTKKVFTNMKRQNKDFSGRVTPLFASMLVPQVVEGEGSGQPSEPQPPSSTAPPSHEEQVTIVASQSQKTHIPRRAKRGRDIEIPQSSGPPKKVGDEAIYIGEEWVLALETSRTAQDLVIQKLKKKVKRLEKKQRTRTPGMKLFKIGTSNRKSLDKEYGSKQGRKSDKIKPMFDDSNFVKLDVDNAMENVEGNAETQGRNIVEQITTAGDTLNTASIDVSAAGPLNVSTADPSTSTTGDIFEDEMMTIADILVAIRSTRPRTTSVIIHDVEEESRRSTPTPTTQPSSKDKGKALMKRLNWKKMQRERAAQEEASNADLIAKFDNVQARIEADALLAARL